MKFIKSLLGDKRGSASSEPRFIAEEPEELPQPEQLSLQESEPVQAAPETSRTNIWDLDDEGDASAPKISTAPTKGQPVRNNRTRVIGFVDSGPEEPDPFSDSPIAPPLERVRFPVGWLIVTDGPGRGYCFALISGMSQIGRGDDQAVRLDFGDNAISRNNHAAVVYDPAEKTFLLGHGGKANIVRLNGKPVIANETLKDGDEIHIGETKLELITLGKRTFDWMNGDDGEDLDDVAIA